MKNNAPKRVKQKKQYVKKLIFVCVVVVLLTLGGSIFGKRSGWFDMVAAKGIIAPISFTRYSNTPIDQIKETFTKAHIPFEEIYASSSSAYIVRQKEGQEIILTSKRDITLQVATLQLILSRLTIEGKSLSRVDLRFDKPVVVFK